jgi:hypothetical protein
MRVVNQAHTHPSLALPHAQKKETPARRTRTHAPATRKMVKRYMAHKDFVSSLTTLLSVVRLSFVVFSGFAIYLEITTDVGVYIRD